MPSTEVQNADINSLAGGSRADVQYVDTSTSANTFHDDVSDRKFSDRDHGDCDVTLMVGDKEVRAHQEVLRAFSPVLKETLKDDTAEVDEEGNPVATWIKYVYVIKYVSPWMDGDALENLMRFAYTGKIAINGETASALLKTADYFRVESVRQACSSYLLDNLDLDTAVAVLRLANDLELDKALRAKCLQLLLRHFEELRKSDSFVKLPVELLLEILQNDGLSCIQEGVVPLPQNQESAILEAAILFAEHIPVGQRECFAQILRSVRLPTLSKARLEQLKETDIVRESQTSELLNKAIDLSVASKKDEDGLASDNDQMWCKARNHIALRHQVSQRFADGGQEATAQKDFDDDDIAGSGHVTGMRIFVRDWNDGSQMVIAGFEVFYSNGRSSCHGGLPEVGDTKTEQFRLEEAEVITSIKVRNGWILDGLEFYTSEGRTMGHYGGDGGSDTVITHPAYQRDPKHGFLRSIRGSTVEGQGGTVVTNLQFVWTYCNVTEGDI